MGWEIRRLDAAAEVATFDCGERTLNQFLQKHALNNDCAGLGRTYVLAEGGSALVAGYFTISTGSVNFAAFSDHAARRLPRYPIPTMHLGRLAIDKKYQGQGLGELLLVSALRRGVSAAEEIGIYVVDVYALHDKAKAFYEKYGFLTMTDSPLHLYLPMPEARAIVGE